jgi:hypothetical protein
LIGVVEKVKGDRSFMGMKGRSLFFAVMRGDREFSNLLK